MKSLLALSLLLSVPSVAIAASPVVETANGNWTYLPLMKQRSDYQLNGKAISRIHELATSGDCSTLVAKRDVLDFRMTFAAQFNEDGTLQRVVMPKLNCPEAEGILGGVLVEMIEKGDYKPDGRNRDGWYRGELSFKVS